MMGGHAENLIAGAQLGPFRIERKLAVGGMAEVWSAEWIRDDGRIRLVALKVMAPALVAEPGFRALFESEVGAVTQLEHPGIVRVHGVYFEEGQLFQVMELLDGLDLRRVLSQLARSKQRVPTGAALFIAEQLASALAYAHTRSSPDGRPLDIVHRDVSPHNVMLTRSGQVKLLDFGLGRVLERRGPKPTMVGIGANKLAYRAPEQALGVGVTPQSDIFSTGVILWEMLAMQRLFRAGNDGDTLALVVAAAIPKIDDKRPEVPAEAAVLLHRMLEQRAPNRPGSMAEVAAGLQRIVAQRGYAEASTAGLARWLAQLFGNARPAPEAAATAEQASDTGPLGASPDITEPVPAPDFDEEGTQEGEGSTGETPVVVDPSGRTVAMEPIGTLALSVSGQLTPVPQASSSDPGDGAPTMALQAARVPTPDNSPVVNTPSESNRESGFRLPTRSEIRRAIEDQPTMPVVADPRFMALAAQGTASRALPRVENITRTDDGPLLVAPVGSDDDSEVESGFDPGAEREEETHDGEARREPMAVHESSPDRLPAVPVSISVAPTERPIEAPGPSANTLQILVLLSGVLALIALALGLVLWLKD